MNYIIVGRNGKPSMKALFENLRNEFVLLYRVISRRTGRPLWYAKTSRSDPQRISEFPTFTPDDMVVRHGTTVPLTFNGARVINQSRAIALSSNKLEARRTLQDAGIPVPQTVFDMEDIGSIVSDAVVRPESHRGGKDFFVVGNERSDLVSVMRTIFEREIKGERFYYSELYPKDHEYRVHVAHGKVLAVNEKALSEGEIRANQAVTGQSWGKVIPWSEYDLNVCQTACNAVKTLGLDYGAVDIMTSSEHEKPVVVCEVNTAPTLVDSPYLLGRYARYFDWLAAGNTEWFEYTEWQKAKSFSWKNRHFNDGREEE